MKLTAAIEQTVLRWETEAVVFNCLHGIKGGEFSRSTWANGSDMVGPVGCRCNQEIPYTVYESLKSNGWKYSL
jgi:hypothetical protein